MLNQIASKAFTLFLILDSIGTVGIVVSLIRRIPEERQAKVLRREMLISLLVMFFFFFFGTGLLNALGISQPAVQITGAIVLFFFALGLLFPKPLAENKDEQVYDEPFIVPIAVPFVAGPTCLATIMLYAHEAGSNSLVTLSAIIIAWVPTALVVMSAPYILKLVGHSGIQVIERLMGLIVTLLAINMFINGLNAYLQTF